MDWNKRNIQITFYKAYMEYLSKARNKLDEEDRKRITSPLSLSLFEKSSLVFVLKETISKMIIVNHGKTSAIELPTSKPPMHVRFNKPILDKLYNEETLEPLRECFKTMSINKLETDIEVIRLALEVCCKEIQQNEFRKFAEFIFRENLEAYDEYNLLKNYCENIEKLEALNHELKQNRQKNEALLMKLNDKLFNLKSECEDREKINRFEENMVNKWEKSRQEQVDAIFNHELKTLYQSRDDYEEKIEQELIAINEIVAFYRTKCTRLEDSIKSWQQRYETERIDFDEQIKKTEKNIEDVISEYEQIRKQYEEREKFIENYYIEQKQLDVIRKVEAGQRAAAIRIQAWWKGTMVRKQLGPYRPKKKSKKPKTGKKK